MRKKNVAIICPQLTGGGAERAAGNLSVELSKYCNVYLFLWYADKISYRYAGRIVRIGEPKSPFLLFFFRKACAVINLLGKYRPDKKTHIYEVKTWLYKKIYRIDCAISFLEPPNFQNIRTAGREKVIVSVRNLKSAATKAGENEFQMMHALYGKADCVVAVAEGVRQDLIKNFAVPAQTCRTIYNFCDAERIRREADAALPAEFVPIFETERVIVNASRLSLQKDQKKLIADFARVAGSVSDVKLLLLGSGGEEANLRAQAEVLGVSDRVFFSAYSSNPFPIIARASMLALTSRYEGYPNVLLEAMALGVPCVSMDCMSGPREILAGRSDYEHPIEGFEVTDRGVLVVDDEDERGGRTHFFADAMALILNDHNLYRTLSVNSTAFMTAYDNDGILTQWLDAAGIIKEETVAEK